MGLAVDAPGVTASAKAELATREFPGKHWPARELIRRISAPISNHRSKKARFHLCSFWFSVELNFPFFKYHYSTTTTESGSSVRYYYDQATESQLLKGPTNRRVGDCI